MRRTRTKSLRLSRFLIIVIILVIAGMLWWWHSGTQAISSQKTPTQSFIVKPGEGLKAIAKDLKDHNLIKSQLVFYLLVKQKHLNTAIQAGEFQIAASMTPIEIAHAFTVGTHDIWITIPEGKRAEEIADILQEKIPTYDQSWRETLNNNEGYLFPDTYLFRRDSSIETIVDRLKTTFNDRYQTLVNQYHPTMTQNEIVTVASLVEREARFAEDRPLVASVIYNRLNLGMALQLDATVQYAIGNESNWWKKDLTATDLAYRSPYNTYINTGLPPTPIANPGEDSLRAAMHPADTQYIYYISDSSGHNHYAKTNEEQNANIKKYGL